MPVRMITLMTDFGTEDGFVAEMKAGILSRFPAAVLVDITHAIPAFDIWRGALVLGRAYRSFPAGTVHLAVVDPGVGGKRKPMILKADSHYFVGPDNGLFSWPMVNDSHHQAMEIHPLPQGLSATFHGRDLFAPVAASLGRGTDWKKLGITLKNPQKFPDLEPVPCGRHQWQGVVLGVDHFGNIATNFSYRLLEKLEKPLLKIGKHKISKRVRTFCEARPHELAMLQNSDGYVEIFSPQASAQARLGCRGRQPIFLRELAKKP